MKLSSLKQSIRVLVAVLLKIAAQYGERERPEPLGAGLSRRLRSLTLSVLHIGLLVAGHAQVMAQDVALEPGRAVEGLMASGQRRSYRLPLEAGQYFHAFAESRELDLMIGLSGPDGQDGQSILESANTYRVPIRKRICYIADRTGEYRLTLRVRGSGATGAYRLLLTDLREATPVDLQRATAQKLAFAATQKRYGDEPGGLRQAIPLYWESLKHWRAAGDREMEAANLYLIGYCHEYLDEGRQAIDPLQQSLAIARELNNEGGVALILYRLGKVASFSGDTREAVERLTESLEITRRTEDHEFEPRALRVLGIAYSEAGDYEQALECFLQTAEKARAYGNRETEAWALDDAGVTLLNLGEPKRAIDYLQRALASSRELREEDMECFVLSHLSSAHLLLGDKSAAMEQAAQSLALSQRIGSKEAEAESNGMMGEVYAELGRKDKAIEHFNQALTIARGIDRRFTMVNSLLRLGSLHREAGRKQEATAALLESLDLARRSGFRPMEYYGLVETARLEAERGAWDSASQKMEIALRGIEGLRAGVASRNLRSSFLGTVQDAYEFYTELLMARHRQDHPGGFAAAALEVNERARARGLVELLAGSQVEFRQGVDRTLRQRERELQQRLSAKSEARLRSIGHESKTGEAAAVEREMAALTEELDRVEAAIHTANPRYAALVKPRTLSTAEIQRQLPGDGTTLLEYSLGRERSYLWAVTKNSLQAYELPPRAEIEQTAQALTASLRMRPAGASRTAAASSEKAAESETLARRLSDMLLRPVAAELRQQRLLIVGDGALNYVPFAALPAPEMGREGEGEKGRRGVGGKRRRGEGERERRKSSILNPQSSILDPPSAIPLILRHEIVTLPSATTLAVLRRETADRAAPAKTVAILADPVFGRHDDRVAQAKTKSDPLAQNSAGERGANPPGKVKVAALEDLERGIKEGVLSGIVLPRLPFSRAEADAIEQTAPAGQAMKALDFAASRDTATSAELGQYRILHIATHGLFNSRHPELSGLFFSLVNERGEARNGLLGIREIYDLQLPADLVVLSACDTALGKEIKGEGVLGLTRGFMYAGARRVVASLWKVNDASTAELMKRFYQGMLGEKKLSPAAALREAQVSMWKEKRWQAPYYWAGFVLQGEW